MKCVYWEDRLTDVQIEKYQKAIEKFQKNKNKRNAGYILYEELTNCGLTAEEANEMTKLEMENC